MTKRVAIVWFRNDLRLTDNPALTAAAATVDAILPVYVHQPTEHGAWAPGAASRWWLHHSLTALDAALREHGNALCVLRGPTLTALESLIEAHSVVAVHWNRVYEPALIERDKLVKQALRARGVEVHSHNASLLHEPWGLLKADGSAYRVFSAYWKAALRKGVDLPPAAAPCHLQTLAKPPAGVALASLELLPRMPWDAGLAARWAPGERGAEDVLGRFFAAGFSGYAQGRDHPARALTSRLSPHLHFGEIGPRRVIAALRAHEAGAPTGATPNVERFLAEIGWREFAHHLLYHFAHTPQAPLDPRFAAFPWTGGATDREVWARGRTGIPIVDAGMRELWETGWMHNRVRMIVASFLTKNLLIDWREGARWFWDTLVDADLANNTLGWQWTAGCGADAAPYFRVFNPVLQGRKFDANGDYVRRFVPELRRLPTRHVHAPWQAPAAELAQAGVRLGETYPRAIVDLKATRERALAVWAALRAD